MAARDLEAVATIGEAWLAVRTAFRAAKLETADLDARLLVTGLTDLEPHQLATCGETALGMAHRRRLAQAVVERIEGRPVHRILGAREFFGLRFGLSPATLEPRPDSETLVDAVLPHVRARIAQTGRCRIADLGIGTGAIGLALLAQCPQADCLGVDISGEAVATAQTNAQALGLTARYRACTGDWLGGIDECFDLIVSNPPYIPSAEVASLSREVAEHDPRLALDGGDDGLDAYRKIAAQAPERMVDCAIMALEIGFGQAADVTSLCVAAGFERTGVYVDLGGVDRVLEFALTGARTGAKVGI